MVRARTMAATATAALLAAVSAAHSAPPKAAEKSDGSTEALRREATRVAAEMRRELGEGFLVIEDAPFVIGGNLSMARLEAIRRDTVRRSAAALWGTFFEKKPDRILRVYLFADEAGYRAGAKRLFGDEGVSRFGYFKPSNGVLVMDISTGEGTLVHELTHALMKPDFPDVPDWFNEGLASLFEQCRFEEGRIVGMVNWRLPLLKRAIAAKRLRPLADLLAGKGGSFYGVGSGENYAQARYFCMYLQSKGVLGKFYKSFRDGPDRDATGSKQAVQALGAKDLETVEREFLRWLEALGSES
jgi:hypothetical protein